MKLFVRAFAIAVVAFGTFAASTLAKNPSASAQVATHNVPGPIIPSCPPGQPDGCGI